MGTDIFKRKRCYTAKSSTYNLYVNTKILLDFYICISVPLRAGIFLQNKFLWLTVPKTATFAKFIFVILDHLREISRNLFSRWTNLKAHTGK